MRVERERERREIAVAMIGNVKLQSSIVRVKLRYYKVPITAYVLFYEKETRAVHKRRKAVAA